MGDKNKETFGIEKQRRERESNPKERKVVGNQGILSNPRKFIRASVRLTMANRTSKEGGIRKLGKKGEGKGMRERERKNLITICSIHTNPSVVSTFFCSGRTEIGEGWGRRKNSRGSEIRQYVCAHAANLIWA